jgi:uncharacterized protein YggT (Ycf19 family)
MQPTGSGDPRDPHYAGAPITADPPHYVEAPQPTPPQPMQPIAPARRVNTDATYAPSWRGWRAGQIVYTIGAIVAVLIVIRIIFELLAANPNAGFSNLIYTITAPLVAPFQGVFPTPQSHGSILDLAAVLAIIVYALLTWGIARVFELIRRRSTPTS